jgi:hypothetical protein
LYKKYNYRKDAMYGPAANNQRSQSGIPIIREYMKPDYVHSDLYRGNRWESDGNPTIDRPFVHKWKSVESNAIDGWLEERDALMFYLNDSTAYQLSIFSKLDKDTVMMNARVGLVDIEHEKWDDYLSGRHSTYFIREISLRQKDSVLAVWFQVQI